MADTEDSRERRRACTRAWRAANPDKYKAQKRRYRAANLEKVRAQKRAQNRAWRAANREKAREQSARSSEKWEQTHPEKARAIQSEEHRKWRMKNRAWVAYSHQRWKAGVRNIIFLLTFEEWLLIWQSSGRWDQRGHGADNYCMARFGDVGPYAVGNVRICTRRENNAEQAANARSRHDTSRL